MGTDGKDEADLRRIEALLRAAGLHVSRIREAQTPRCDLAAKDDRFSYLVEVKGFHDPEAVERTLRHDGFYTGNRQIVRSGSVSRRIDEAVAQLRSTAAAWTGELWLVVLIDRGPLWSGIIMDQILVTLYGIRSIAEVAPSGHCRECLYFSDSAFHKRRLGPDGVPIDAVELDGAIILGTDGAGLCVNDHSERAQGLKESRLGRFFAELGLLHDAARLESEGGYLVADCDIDRSDEHAVLQYLARKYGLNRPVAMHSFGFAGAFRVAKPSYDGPRLG